MNKLSTIIYISIIIIFSFIFRFHNLSNFYSETDDQIAIEQLIKYENIDIYSIANEKDAPSYNGILKKKIREIEKKNNSLINQFQKFTSKFLFNMAPSKHSTFAPMQYAIFGWMVSPEHTYKELKLYSRIPSAILSVLTVFLIYLISLKLFKRNNFLQLYPALFTTFSLPLIYISQRSYNYSASGFAYLILILIFLKQFSLKKNSLFVIKVENIQLFNNIIISISLASLAYLNYQLLIIMPIIFLYLFFYNFIKIKKIISFFSINLVLIGIFYSILVAPLLLYMIKFNLNEYGMTASTAGEHLEYALNIVTSKTNNIDGTFTNLEFHFIDTIKFYINNTYLIVSKNLSFFTDKYIYAKHLQFTIFILTIYGIFCVYFNKNKNKLFKNFTNFILLSYVYWCALTFYNITNLGPTRHLQIFTPILTIFLSYGLYNLIYLLDSEFSKKFVKIICTICIITIFTLNYKPFLDYYEDPFDEVRINKLTKKFNIGFIMNSASFAHNLCYMNSIKIKIYTCPQPIESTRHNYPVYEPEIDEIMKLKHKGQSVLLLNLVSANEIYNIDPNDKVKRSDNITKKLELGGFELIQKINENNFSIKSPLYISKYRRNFFTLDIYK